MKTGKLLACALLLTLLFCAMPVASAQVGTPGFDYSSVKGFNYTPAYAWNSTGAFVDFDPVWIDRELAYAESLGVNWMRIFLPYILWEQDHALFVNVLPQYLALLKQHGITPLLVLFDSCFGIAASTETTEYWASQPGVFHTDFDLYPNFYLSMASYADEVIALAQAANNPFAVDVWNEPQSSFFMDNVPFGNAKPQTWALIIWLVRDHLAVQHPSVVVTVGAAVNASAVTSGTLPIDFMSYHIYQGGIPQLTLAVQAAKANAALAGIPLLVTECGHPSIGQTYADVVQVMNAESVGYLLWELMVSPHGRVVGHWSGDCGVFYYRTDSRIQVRSLPEAQAIAGGPLPSSFFQDDEFPLGSVVPEKPLIVAGMARLRQTPVSLDPLTLPERFSLLVMLAWTKGTWLGSYASTAQTQLWAIETLVLQGNPLAYTMLDQLFENVYRILTV